MENFQRIDTDTGARVVRAREDVHLGVSGEDVDVFRKSCLRDLMFCSFVYVFSIL